VTRYSEENHAKQGRIGRDPRDCSRETIENYSRLNEAVTHVDKLLSAVLPRCILTQRTA